MLCGKCCWSQLFKALHVDSCWGDGETADLHFSVKIQCFVMDNLILFSFFIFCPSSKSPRKTMKLSEYEDIWMSLVKTLCLVPLKPALPLFGCSLFPDLSLWRRLSCNGMSLKKSQLAGRRYGSQALMRVLIFAALWYCPKDGSNIYWIDNEVTLIVRGPKRWCQHLGGFHEMMLWVFSSLVVNLETSQALT